jgi:hypothetical protein
VIRRGFWLTVGAVAGIAGYRRVSAVGRRVSGRLTRAGAPSLDGPDQYGPSQSEPSQSGHSQNGQRLDAKRLDAKRLDAKRVGARSLAVKGLAAKNLAVQTIRFTRDVREGMDLYMARHSKPAGPTLGARDVPPAGRRSILTNHDPRPKDGH